MCDWTVGGTFIWRDLYEYEVAFVDDCLIFRMKIFGTHHAYTVPRGEHIGNALDALEAHCEAVGDPLVFSIVGDHDLPLLSERYPGFHAVSERDYYDYLYDARDLLALEGRQHKSTRNNINRFRRQTPDWRFEKIDATNIDDVRRYVDEERQYIPEDHATLIEESNKIHEVLDHMDAYRMFGGVLYVGDTVIGYSLGEVVGDTLYVHTEKADVAYRGAYQMLVACFMDMYGDDPDIAFVNREDDNGDPGLRRSKTTYGPVALISKYTVYTSDDHLEWRERTYLEG